MPWHWWTEQHWGYLLAVVREDGLDMPEPELREVATRYMALGPDGGGNRHGATGIYIAMQVDRIGRAHAQTLRPRGTQ